MTLIVDSEGVGGLIRYDSKGWMVVPALPRGALLDANRQALRLARPATVPRLVAGGGARSSQPAAEGDDGYGPARRDELLLDMAHEFASG